MPKLPALSFHRELKRQVACLLALRACFYLGAMSSYFIGIMGTLTFALGQGVLESACAVGLMNLAQMVGNAWGGSLIDRHGVTVHAKITLVIMAACAVAFQPLAASSAGVMVTAVLFGFALGFADLVARSYPAYLTSDAGELKQINSLLMLVGNISIVVGPAIGGLITLVAPIRAIFLFMGACSLCAIVPLRWFRPLCIPSADTAGTETGMGSNPVSQGFRAIFSSPVLTLLFWSTMLAFVGFGAFDPLETLYYRDVLHVGTAWLGWLSSVAGVGGIMGTVLAGALPRRRVNMHSMLMVLMMLGVSCILYVATASPWIAMAGQFCVGVFNGMFLPLKDTLVQTNAPLTHIGRVSAAMTIGYNLGGVAPLLCAPFLAHLFGVQGTLMGASLAVALVPAAIMAARGHARREAEEGS